MEKKEGNFDSRPADLFGFEEMIYERGLDKNSTVFTISIEENSKTFNDLILLSRISENANKNLMIKKKGTNKQIRLSRCKDFR